MSTIFRADAEFSQREKTLGITAILAVLLHGLVFCGVHWTLPDVAQPAPREQGISINFSPAPSPAPERSAPEPVWQPAPEPERQEKPPVVEPVPVAVPEPAPKVARPRQPRPQRASAAVPRVDKPATPTETAQPRITATTAKEPSGAADPEPLRSYANPKPVYPELARKRGQEGLVRLKAYVDDRGELLELVVAKGSGFSLLDDAAMKAVRSWRFKPGLRDGQPVKGYVVIPVEFRLR